MKKTYLKPRKWCMILFTISDLFLMNVYDVDGRRKKRNIYKQKPRKKSPVWLPSHPPVYEKDGGRLGYGVGSLDCRECDAMGRQRREGWRQHCPLSYDQAPCIHPPFTECYAIQAFSIASDFDSQLMPKIQNQITMRKVCIVIQSLVSRRPNHHSGYS